MILKSANCRSGMTSFWRRNSFRLESIIYFTWLVWNFILYMESLFMYFETSSLDKFRLLFLHKSWINITLFISRTESFNATSRLNISLFHLTTGTFRGSLNRYIYNIFYEGIKSLIIIYLNLLEKCRFIFTLYLKVVNIRGFNNRY